MLKIIAKVDHKVGGEDQNIPEPALANDKQKRVATSNNKKEGFILGRSGVPVLTRKKV